MILSEAEPYDTERQGWMTSCLEVSGAALSDLADGATLARVIEGVETNKWKKNMSASVSWTKPTPAIMKNIIAISYICHVVPDHRTYLEFTETLSLPKCPLS